MIGAFVPGTGDAANGMVLDTDASYPDGFRDQPPVLVEPRVGFAYDLRGNGKTAVRGSFGIFYNTRNTGNTNWTASRNPPLQFNPTLFYGNLGSLLQSSTVLFPSNVQGFDQEVKTPRLYSYTIGVQRDIGWNTVVDVAYVGTKGRNLLNTQNINTVPYGARFLAQNLDPTRANTPLPGQLLPARIPATATSRSTGTSASPNYDALQMQANRRFAKGFQFGAGLHALEGRTTMRRPTPSAAAAVSEPRRLELRPAPRSTRRTSRSSTTRGTCRARASCGTTRWCARLLDNWQLSGITAFASGPPSGSRDDHAGIGGIDVHSSRRTVRLHRGRRRHRVVMTGDPTLSSGERIARSLVRHIGLSAPGARRDRQGPQGRHSPAGHPRVGHDDLQERPARGRADATCSCGGRPTTSSTTPSSTWSTRQRAFDAAGNQTNANFGRVTSTRAPRTMQGSIRFSF